MQQYKGIFASSQDPTGQTLSLTVSSATQALIGLVASIAVIKGVDPALATQNVQSVSDAVQNIVAQYLAIVPCAYSAYHSMQMVWGVVRKFFPVTAQA